MFKEHHTISLELPTEHGNNMKGVSNARDFWSLAKWPSVAWLKKCRFWVICCNPFGYLHWNFSKGATRLPCLKALSSYQASFLFKIWSRQAYIKLSEQWIYLTSQNSTPKSQESFSCIVSSRWLNLYQYTGVYCYFPTWKLLGSQEKGDVFNRKFLTKVHRINGSAWIAAARVLPGPQQN